MTERHKFILAQEERLFSMTELCERFGISRKTGYKWLNRYREEGNAPQALLEERQTEAARENDRAR